MTQRRHQPLAISHPGSSSQGGSVVKSSLQSNVRTSADHTREHRMPPAQPLPNVGRSEISPTTPVRVGARETYRPHYPVDYGHHRSRMKHLVRTPTKSYPQPSTGRPHGAKLKARGAPDAIHPFHDRLDLTVYPPHRHAVFVWSGR